MSTVYGERSERIGAGSLNSSAETYPLPPLVVDLDGTLIKTDLLVESLLALLRKHPLCLFLLPLWITRGAAWLKHEVARRANSSVDVALLPWRTEFIEDLRRQRASGRSLVLATGSDIRFATEVSRHLGLFDLVLATDGITNLCGEVKRQVLVSRFGEKGFDYVADGGGNSHADLAVWRSARKAIHIAPEPRAHSAAAFIKALRPAHWLKNLLVFVPLVAAHRLLDFGLFGKACLAFVAFCCCASSGYLLNDLLDLEADRRHPHKRVRPFASGDLPLTTALFASPALFVGGCLLGALVSPLLLVALLGYFAVSAAYSLYFKKVALLDVLVLAGLYTVRIMGGAAAVGIGTSHWLLAFTTFLFFSLALVKRYSELVIMRRADGEEAKARAYELSDAELLAAMGVASGYVAVMVLALYIASDKAQSLYIHRELLWFLCPVLLYWVSYLWLTAHRGRMPDDPVQFAIRDRTSLILLCLLIATSVVAL